MADEPALILVVDDNEMNRDLLSRRLKRLGHNTMVAEDGEKALEAIQENQFDLVLLDIMMPNLNGYDTLERIKSNEATRHLPVIMISAVDDLESVVRCIELGAEDYLFKPFNPVLLKARVGAGLEKSRLLVSANNTGPAITPDMRQLIQSIQQEVKTLASDSDNLSELQRSTIKTIRDATEELIQLFG